MWKKPFTLVLAALWLQSSSSFSKTHHTATRFADRIVSEDDRASFRDNGVVVLRRVFNEKYVNEIRAESEGILRSPGPNSEDLSRPGEIISAESVHPIGYFTDLEVSDRSPILRHLLEDGLAAAIAGRLSGSKTERLLQDQIFIKPPGPAGGGTKWHQDSTSCACCGDNILTVSIALDDVPEIECLQFVGGSHRWLELSVPFEEAIEVKVNDAPKLSWSLSAGDIIVFEGRTIHGGPGGWGRSYALRFMGDGVRWNSRGDMFGDVIEPAPVDETSESDDEFRGFFEGDPIERLPPEGLLRDGLPSLFPLVWFA